MPKPVDLLIAATLDQSWLHPWTPLLATHRPWPSYRRLFQRVAHSRSVRPAISPRLDPDHYPQQASTNTDADPDRRVVVLVDTGAPVTDTRYEPKGLHIGRRTTVQ